MTVVLLKCVAFVCLFFRALMILIEQSFYMAHQKKHEIVVEPGVLPHFADELDDFVGRKSGDINRFLFLNVIKFGIDGWCTYERKL